MNLKSHSTFKILFFTIYLLIGILLSLSKNTQYLSTEYNFILTAYFITGGAWGLCIYKKNIYIFEPATIVLGLTIITYAVAPLISINTNDLTINGFYVFDGCVEATIIYILAFCLFLFIYYSQPPISFNSIRKKQFYLPQKQIRKKIIIIAFGFSLLSISICLLDLLQKGFSLNYILSLGTQGYLEKTEDQGGAIINLRYLMIPCFLYIDLLSTQKKEKYFNWILRLIAIACLFMTNKRWLIIVVILSPIVLYYLRNKKSPPIWLTSILGCILFFLNGAMQYMRYYATTSILNVDWSGLNFSELWKGISGNFDLYKTLYAAVLYFPYYHPHTLGEQMIYLTAVTCIPRSLWPEKPISIFEQLKGQFIGQGSIDGAWAYAQLTEFYIEFGIIGTLFLFGLFAKLCLWLKKKAIIPRTYHDLVIASFMFPMLMQLVIRGYLPINFWALFFMTIPILCIIKINRYLNKNGNSNNRLRHR